MGLFPLGQLLQGLSAILGVGEEPAVLGHVLVVLLLLDLGSHLGLGLGILTVALLLALLLYAHLLGCKIEEHALSFELRKLLYLGILLQVVGKAEQKHLTLLLEEDTTATEENVGAYLVALVEELDGVLELELVVVLVGLGSETNLLHLLTHLFLLQFLLATLLLIEELGIVDETTNRRLGIRRDLDQIDTLLPSESKAFRVGITSEPSSDTTRTSRT